MLFYLPKEITFNKSCISAEIYYHITFQDPTLSGDNFPATSGYRSILHKNLSVGSKLIEGNINTKTWHHKPPFPCRNIRFLDVCSKADNTGYTTMAQSSKPRLL
jgi:hypothetical protein